MTEPQTVAPGDTPSVAAIDTPTVVSPPRPVWATEPPRTAWCPPEWEARLAEVASGIVQPADGEEPIAASPEAVTIGADHGDWRLIGASRRGRLHAHRAEHREDAVAHATWRGGWCIAVADGAGSSPYSRIGSAIVTRIFTEQIAHMVPRDVRALGTTSIGDALRESLAQANTALRRFADDVGEPWKAFRTTLLATVVHGEHLATVQIGDGAILLRAVDGTVHHPYTPAVGEYSGEVAHFLPDEGALEVGQASVQITEATPYDTVVLCTDGVEDPWYPLTRYGQALLGEWSGRATDSQSLPAGYIAAAAPRVMDNARSSLASAEALATWLAFEKRGENDDRTAAIAWRANA